MVPVATPDFTGAMESGYALAVAAVIEQLVPRSKRCRDPAGSASAPGQCTGGRPLDPR